MTSIADIVAPMKWVRVIDSDSPLVQKSETNSEHLVRTLDGREMQDHDSLFREFALELDFPSYFGGNWPALHDCLDDLEWLGEFRSIEIVIRNWPQVLAKSPKDRKVLLRLLNRLGDDWNVLGRDGTGLNAVSFKVALIVD